MTVGERIKSRRTQLQMSVDELAKAIGKDRATVYRYESREIEKLPLDIIVPLAKALRTTPAFIMGWEEEEFNIPKNIFPLTQISKIPVIGRIACGTPILAEENFESMTFCPDNVNADFALRCKGDSMIDADIHDGDIVYIRSAPIVENGEIAAVVIGEEATLKKVYYQGDTLTLLPANTAYAPMVYTNEQLNDIHICGKVVALLRHMSK